MSRRPTRWPEVALGEVAVIERSSFQASDIPSGTTYVGLENIESGGGGGFINLRAVDAGELGSSKFRFGPGHLLYGKLRPYLAKIACPDFKGICSTDILPIMPRPNLERHYLFHYLSQPAMVTYASSRAVGINLPRLAPSVLTEFRIPLPPLNEQRRIAEILDGAAAMQARRRATLAQLDTVVQSIFSDMFGDTSANPKGWPVKRLSDLLSGAEIFVDGDWVESKDQDPDGEIRLVQLADIGDGIYVSKSARFLNKAAALRLRCTGLKVGDILVARMPDPLGRACLFPGDKKPAVTVVDVCIIRPADANPDPLWLMHCINTAGFRDQIGRHATGTTRARISRGNLSRLLVIGPPLALQQEFARRALAVDDLRAVYQLSLQKLVALFGSLQHRAFRGEL